METDLGKWCSTISYFVEGTHSTRVSSERKLSWIFLFSYFTNFLREISHYFAKMNFAKGSKNYDEFCKKKKKYATISPKNCNIFCETKDFPISLETLHNTHYTFSYNTLHFFKITPSKRTYVLISTSNSFKLDLNINPPPPHGRMASLTSIPSIPQFTHKYRVAATRLTVALP